MKLLRLTIVLAFAALLCAAQPLETQKSAGMANGRFWTGMTDSGRIFFMAGYVEHLLVAGGQGWGDDVSILEFPQFPVTVGEIVKGLNRIYDSPENLGIPIAFAINIFAKRVGGATEAEIGDLLRIARQSSISRPR